MTKTELIRELATASETTLKKTGEMVDRLLSIIKREVIADRPVSINGFGKWYLHTMPERQTWNPLKKEKMTIPERTYVKFRSFLKVKP